MQLDFSLFFIAYFSQSIPTDLGCNPRGVATTHVTFHLWHLHGLLCKQPGLSWAHQKALAQWPILGELHTEAGTLPQQCCPTCCKDEQSILAFWEKFSLVSKPEVSQLEEPVWAHRITSRSGGKAGIYRKALSLSCGLVYLYLFLLTFGETLFASLWRPFPSQSPTVSVLEKACSGVKCLVSQASHLLFSLLTLSPAICPIPTSQLPGGLPTSHRTWYGGWEDSSAGVTGLVSTASCPDCSRCSSGHDNHLYWHPALPCAPCPGKLGPHRPGSRLLLINDPVWHMGGGKPAKNIHWCWVQQRGVRDLHEAKKKDRDALRPL